MDAKRLKPLVIVAAVFFVLTSWFARPVNGQWDSPDETANAFWAARVANNAPLAIHDVIVGLAHGAVHPRSFAVVGDALVPGSFPGIFFLYGLVNRFLRLPLWMLTPLLTALAGLALGRALRPLFGERIAFWSTMLFFAHPAVIYYAARGMFNNLLCIDLLIFAAFVLIAKPFARAWERNGADVDAMAAGLLFAGAMCTRLSEAVWALPLFLVLAWRAGERPLRRMIFIALGAALPIFLLLQFNAATYGSPFRTGYVAPPSAASATSSSIAAAAAVLPFGLHPKLILRNAWYYGLRFFWWLSLPGVLGALLWWVDRRHGHHRGERSYLIAAVFTAVWLSIFYGSWLVQDRWDASSVTIGTSYVRYFLPAYLMFLPFAAKAFLTLSDHSRTPKRLIVESVLIAAALSLNIAIFSGDEGLRSVRTVLTQNSDKQMLLRGSIPAGAIVMTARFDKVLFPDVLRIMPVFDTASFDAVAALAPKVGLYYYGLDADPGERALVERETAARGLVMQRVAAPWNGETLFRFIK